MLIKDIVARVNSKLAGERLTYDKLKFILDEVIDDINSDLNATFPAFSELDLSVSAYTALPDKYIRSVVVTGAVHKYFVQDEEGLDVAPAFLADYIMNRFLMVRDYHILVPAEYRASNTVEGMLQFNEAQPQVEVAKGMWVDGTYFHN